MEKIMCFLKRPEHSNSLSACLLAIRVVMGVAFVYHGLAKSGAPFSWMQGESGVPGFLQFLAFFSELGGGIALAVGLLVPLASLGLFSTMCVAVVLHAVILGDPFVSTGGGSFELPLIYLVLSAVFIVLGPGKYSLDYKIFK